MPIMVKNKILLVGSGGSLKGSKSGDMIDNFDGLVCRFNSYITTDYEEDLGTKCDIWCMNPRIFFELYFEGHSAITPELLLTSEIVDTFEGEILIAGKNHIGYNIKDSEYLNEAVDEYDNAKFITAESLKLGYELVGNYKYCQICERNHSMIPSTGIQAILHYLNLNYDVYILGFDISNNNLKLNQNKHYYSEHLFNKHEDTNEHPSFALREHNIKKEIKIINILETLKCVKRLD